MAMQQWDRVVDVVVVGSGGAALVAATLAHDQGAETLVVEKAAMIGGTTAVSGGAMGTLSPSVRVRLAAPQPPCTVSSVGRAASS